MTVAVGFFDGVHLGHQAILKGADAVLTFRQHPLSLLAPEKSPRLIMPLKARLAAIRALGISQVTALDFTPELAAMSPGAFAAKYLYCGSEPMLVRCGANWNFGKNGEGDAEWLTAHGVPVKVVTFAEYDGERVSSSRIRAALENGEIEAANAMLGRKFKVEGSRFKGKGMGQQIGYPTINLKLSSVDSEFSVALPHGVYAVEFNGERGIANYGCAPTLGTDAWQTPILEIHLLNPHPSTFNPRPSDSVEFICYIRPERKFSSLEELSSQIRLDCAKIEGN